MAITACLSRSLGLLNPGPGGPASLWHVPHSSIFSPTATAQLGVLRAPSAGCWFSLQHLISNWLELPVHRVILLFYAHSIQPIDSQGYPLVTFNRVHLLYTGAFPILTARLGSICNINVTFMFKSFFNSLAKSRYLSFFSFSFNFTQWSAETAKSIIFASSFFGAYYKVWSSGRD